VEAVVLEGVAVDFLSEFASCPEPVDHRLPLSETLVVSNPRLADLEVRGRSSQDTDQVGFDPLLYLTSGFQVALEHLEHC
jgi:hypothetical protein